ncbi:MAG TPA: peptidoglycan-binding protein [Thermoleophilaceae bacterium]
MKFHARWQAGVVVVGLAMLTLVGPQQAVARSANVAALQVALKSAGLYPAAVDGIRGAATRRAVRRFQRRKHLTVDGVVGPQTRHALGRRGRPRLGSRLVRAGQRGWDVAALQFLLGRHGYPPGPVDGVFGPGTRAAVLRFQRTAGLAVDGVAGPATLAALRRGGATSGPRSIPVSSPVGPVRFYRPVPGPIGDGFGAPREGGRRHMGLDFPVPYGTLVQAAGRGTTAFAGFNRGGYGNLVVVAHRLGYTTYYGHLSRITSWVGENVVGGTRLGYVGATGHATGPHLHFEVRLNGTPIDPLPYLLPTTPVRAASVWRCPTRPRHEIDYRTVEEGRC